MKKIALNVYGQEMFFSEEELVKILEKHFANQKKIYKPKEDIYFQVDPNSINKALFLEKREDLLQEHTRILILEAINKVSQYPEKYGKPFKTKIPKKDWSMKTVKELKKIANNSGNHIADWVEQALEWAQKIQNGETWENICNEPDPLNWHRLIIWKNRYIRLVGGSSQSKDYKPASHVFKSNLYSENIMKDAVPLIVFYD